MWMRLPVDKMCNDPGSNYPGAEEIDMALYKPSRFQESTVCQCFRHQYLPYSAYGAQLPRG